MATSSKCIRITVVGDGATGKTSMLIVYKDKTYNEAYLPTVFDVYSMTIPINSEEYTVILSDTAGQEEFDKLRKLAYDKTDLFILCYSVDSLDSYENVYFKWAPELKKFCPTAKIVLAGTKIDLRRNSPDSYITTEQGRLLAKKINANAFIENSSRLNYNVNETFNLAILEVVKNRLKPVKNRRNRRKGECTIL